MQDNLTTRELEVSEKISLGYLDKEIADILCICPETVRSHIKKIKRKVPGIHNRVDIAREYILSLDNPKKYYKKAMAVVATVLILASALDTEKLCRRGRRGRRQHRIESLT